MLSQLIDWRTVLRRYMPQGGRPRDRVSSHHLTSGAPFVRNHAGAMLARDFFVRIIARFRTLYVFVVLMNIEGLTCGEDRPTQNGPC